jgi:monofunctional biosynthetic peptidoglycan transglycosylase
MSPNQHPLFNFQSPPEQPYWRIVNDRVMGGLSQSSYHVTEDQTGLFEGTLSLEKSGGFCSVRFTRQVQDLPDLAGFALRCRGSVSTFQFRLYLASDDSRPAFAASFQPPDGSWGEIHLPLASFTAVQRGTTIPDLPPPHPGEIHQVGLLIADQQQGDFWLEIDWIRAY